MKSNGAAAGDGDGDAYVFVKLFVCATEAPNDDLELLFCIDGADVAGLTLIEMSFLAGA